MKRLTARLPLFIIAAPGAALAAGGEESLTLRQPPGQTTAQPAMKAQQIEELHDIHGPVPITGHPPYWAIGGTIAVVLAILAALYFYLKKRRRPAPPVPLSAWETALAELAAAKKLQSQALLYMEKASEILRRYIESRFAIRSTRQTTREFLAGLSHTGQHNPLAPYRPELQACLEQADMAKFARLVPDSGIVAQMERAVTDFVRKTEPPATGGRP